MFCSAFISFAYLSFSLCVCVCLCLCAFCVTVALRAAHSHLPSVFRSTRAFVVLCVADSVAMFVLAFAASFLVDALQLAGI